MINSFRTKKFTNKFISILCDKMPLSPGWFEQNNENMSLQYEGDLARPKVEDIFLNDND